MRSVCVVFLLVETVFGGLFDIQEIISDELTTLPREFSLAIKDIAEGLPAKSFIVVRGNSTNIRSEDVFQLLCELNAHRIPVINLDVATQEKKDKYYSFLKQALDTSEERTSLILCEPFECENILIELTEANLIHRMIVYLFYWPYGAITDRFFSNIREAMRVAVITNPRPSVYKTCSGQDSIGVRTNRITNYVIVQALYSQGGLIELHWRGEM